MNRSTEPDFDQRIADWLEDGPDLAPREALDIVLAAVPSISQRRTLRAPRRLSTMTLPIRLATAAVIGVLVVGGVLLLFRTVPGNIGVPAPSPSPSTVAPSWTAAASLGTGRVDFAATTLADGRILLAGGSNAAGGLASAEIYDPAAGTWTATGPMGQARALHSLTRLSDGKVLVVGGGADTSQAELYDPTTGIWTPTGRLTNGRFQSMTALLRDGRVLVAGGTDGATPVAAEIYDPATRTWALTGVMTEWRSSSSTTVLADGTVLVAGGFGQSPGGTTSAEIYDPRTGAWTATGSMTSARSDGQTSTLLGDGRVLVTGGGSATPELYDPVKRTWTTTAAVGTSAGETATMLSDGRVLIAGGLGTDGTNAVASAMLFDPTANLWSGTLPMNDARLSGEAVLLADGRVFAFGGSTTGSGGTYLASAELYEPGGR